MSNSASDGRPPDASELLEAVAGLNLQSRYELEVERDRLAETLDQIKPLATA